jgi:phosphoglycerol transferase MdoB-like AlkP superfamily enzyme
MANAASGAGSLFVAGLIVCVVIIAIDWFADGKPDKAAFWAAFFLAGMVVFGAASLPRVGDQIGNGANQVGSQIQRVGP